MKKELIHWNHDPDCFYCGTQNPIGLKLKFYLDEETQEVFTEYEASKLFVAFGNIMHAGIQSGLFDEIMGWATYNLTGQMGLTSEIKIKFLRPAYVGKKLIVSCRIISHDGPEVQLSARIETPEGKVCSKATGTYYLLPQDAFRTFIVDKK